jgi:hypothetical protein
MRYGLPLPERIQKFNELLANRQANSISKHDVPTINGTELYDVFHVSIELPKYRLDNTRTLALQEQYIYNNSKGEDYFNDVESDEIQEIQHGFLCSLIRSSDREKDLLNYFSTRTQTEPLILTHDGFVLSGNRRLCAFRELLGRDMEHFDDYKHFSLVRVVILPHLDQDKIDQLEDFLEQQTDIKENFSWVSRALGYRRRIHKYGYSDDILSSITGINKNVIRSLVDKIEIADRYLESINKPKDYNQILDDFYAFDKIYSCQTKSKGAPSSKIAFEKIAFLSIKNKGSFSDRMYKNIPLINEIQASIHNEIGLNFPNEIAQIEKEIQENSQVDIPVLFPDPTIPLIKLIENPYHEQKIVEIVSDKIEEYLALEREKKKKSSVLERVTKANTLLIEANTIKNHETDKIGVLNQIVNLEREVEKLKTWAQGE